MDRNKLKVSNLTDKSVERDRKMPNKEGHPWNDGFGDIDKKAESGLNDLLNCPFCGSKPTIKNDNGLSWIACPKDSICQESGIIFAFKTSLIKKGIEVWNTRAI